MLGPTSSHAKYPSGLLLSLDLRTSPCTWVCPYPTPQPSTMGQTEHFPITRTAQCTSHFSGCWGEKSDGKYLKAGRLCWGSLWQRAVHHGEKGVEAGT